MKKDNIKFSIKKSNLGKEKISILYKGVQDRLIKNRLKVVCLIFGIIFISLLGMAYLTPVHRMGDSSTYYMQISSIANDFDIQYQYKDIHRAIENKFDDLPAGLILIKTHDGRYYYGKEFSLALFAAPFFKLLGKNGIIIFNAFLFGLMILMGYLYLRRHNNEVISIIVSSTFFLISTAFVYIFWIHAEIYNMFLITAGIFFWLEYRNNLRKQYLFISFIIIGIGVVAKIPNLMVFVPIICYELVTVFTIPCKRINNSYYPNYYICIHRLKQLIILVIIFLLPIAIFYGSFYVNSGAKSFYGGERLFYKGEFPFVNGYDNVNEVGHRGFSVEENTHLSTLFLDIDNIKISFYNFFYYFFGKFTGMIWYYPFALFALISFLLGFSYIVNETSNINAIFDYIIKNKEKCLILLGIMLNILTFILIIGSNYFGGQHAIGNRYFYIYPAFLFLLGVVDLKKFLSFTLVALIVVLPIIADPIGNSIRPEKHTYNFPYNEFPVEINHIEGLPIWEGNKNYSDLKIYLLDNNAKFQGDYIFVPNQSETLIYSKQELEELNIFLYKHNQGPVSISIGKEKILIDNDNKTELVSLSMQNPVYYDNRYYLYKLFISSDNGISFRLVKNSDDIPSFEVDGPILFGNGGNSEKYLLAGWSNPEEGFTWTDGHKSVLGIKIGNPDSDLNLKIRASQYTKKQRVNVTVNGHPVGNWTFDKPEGQEKSIIIPHDVLKEGVQNIALELPDVKSSQSLGLSDDSRILGLAVQSLVINSSTESPYHPYEYGKTILFGKNGTCDQYLFDGWANPEEGYTWTDGYKSVLGIKTRENNSDLKLKIKASQYTSKQRVNVTVNDHPVGNWIFDKPEGQEKSIIIPHDVLKEGMQYIAFGLPDAKSPQSLGLSDDSRILGLAVQSLVINSSTESPYHPYEYGKTILFGKNGTCDQYLFDGWANPEEGYTWTDGYKSVLGIKTRENNSDLKLKIKASQYTSKQRVNVTVNDHPVGNWIFDKPEDQEKSIIIPHGVLKEGMQYIAFELPDAKSPQSLGLSDDNRILALAVQSLVINSSKELRLVQGTLTCG
jgi:hypothetical protein